MDFCNKDLCVQQLSNGSVVTFNHIACNNNNQFASNCPSNAVVAEFNDTVKQYILDQHNIFRNNLASGSLGVSQAQRMLVMEWDRMLEYLAGLSTKRCIFEHDKCRSTNAYPYSGQNLGVRGVFKGPALTMPSIKILLNLWLTELQFCDQTSLSSFKPNPDTSKSWGHCTLMLRDDNYAIGCAASLYTTADGYTWFYFACNYGSNNFLGEAVYEPGKAGSGCSTGGDSRFTSLCNANENKINL